MLYGYAKFIGVCFLLALSWNISTAQTLTFSVPATNPISYPVGTGLTTFTVNGSPAALTTDVATNVVFSLPPLGGATVLPTFLSTAYSVNADLSTLAVGTYTLTATYNTQSLIGATPRTPVVKTTTILIAPLAPTVIATPVCGSGTSVITASGGAPTGGTYNFYNVATNGTALQSTTSNTYTTASISTSTPYYVSYTVNGVTSPRKSVTVTVNALPTTPVITPSAPAAIAVGALTSFSVPTPAAGVTISWNTGGGTPATTTGTSLSVSWATAGTKTVTATATNTTTGCTSSSSVNITVTVPPYVGAYGFRIPVTLNNAALALTSDLANFPVLVYIQDDALKILPGCSNKVQFPDGPVYDFAFTASGSTAELNYDVESFDKLAGALLVWVRIPTLVRTTNYSLTFYFGSLTANAVNVKESTWASDYRAIYHFNEKSTTATILDATSFNIDAAPTNLAIGTDRFHEATGLTGGAYIFDGTSKIVSTFNAPITGSFTLSAWVYTAVPSGDNKILSNEVNYGKGYKLSVKNGSVETETRNTSNFNPGHLFQSGTVQASQWQYIQGVFNSSSNSFTNYVNGVSTTAAVTTGAPEADATNGNVVSLGVDYISTTLAANPFKGSMDEVRISNVVKTADWIKAEFTDQNDPISFRTQGTYQTDFTNASTLKGGITYNTVDGINYTYTINSITTAGALPNTGNANVVVTGASATITAGSSIYGLTINPSSSLNLNGQTVSIGCNVYNSGTITNTTSSIIFNGTFTPQLYAATATTNTAEFGSITVNNITSLGQVKVSGGPINLYNTLTLTNGSLYIDNTNNGALTLKSSQTLTATVAEITSASSQVIGQVNAERYLSGGTTKDATTGRWVFRNYRLMSSPVNTISANTGSTLTYPYTFTYLANSAIVTGAIGGYKKSTNTFISTTAEGNPTIYLYRENKAPSNAGFTAGNFAGVTDITSSTVNTTDGTKTVSVGNGYMFFFRGNRTANLTTAGGNKTTSPYVLVEPVVFTATGYLNQGAYQVKHWYTGTTNLLYTNPGFPAVMGFNLVGNPYASSIDWEKFAATGTSGIVGTNLSTTIYVFNPQTNTYNTYKKGDSGVGKGTDLTTPNGYTQANIIPSGQGFFVRGTAANPTLTFYESAKSATQVTSSNLLLSTAKPAEQAKPQFMRLLLVKDSLNFEDNLIFFNASANLKYNEAEDAEYLPGNSPAQTLSSLSSDGVKLAINRFSLPGNNETRVVKLNVSATNTGIYTLKNLAINEVPDVYDFWLRDKLKRDSLDIKHNKTYNFNIDKADSTTFGANRLELVIRQNKDKILRLLDFTGLKVTDGVKLNWKTENESNYTNFTVEKSIDNGATYNVVDGFLSNSSGAYSITDKRPATGLNKYRLKQDDINGTITYSKVVDLMYANIPSNKNDSFTIYPNPVVSDINLNISNQDATKSYSITITNSNGMVMKSAIVTGPNWHSNVSSLMPGTYIIHIINNDTKVDTGTGKFIKL